MSPLSETLRRRAERIFQEAILLPNKQRKLFIRQQSYGDTKLWKELRSLLEAFDKSDKFLERSSHTETVVDEEQAFLGVRIGSFRTLSILGSGGMSVVYVAEQKNPKRLVALKIVRPSLISDQLVRRFELEAELLGRLKHPGIAQIFEAGTFKLGYRTCPFFVMEYVEGPSLADYANENKLATRQKLHLLVKICEAVQHAHQHGVIHRDLKPDNIVIGHGGQPKILDFGVAKAINGDQQALTLATTVGNIVGTVPYMSPEQARGDATQVDTRSDVYTLGVLGFEILAGFLPYDFNGYHVLDSLRVIQDREPVKLGTVKREYRGDIESIFSKALSKDKVNRYSSASMLSADILSFLNYEPVSVRRPGGIHRFRRFSKKHKQRLFILGTLLIGLAGTSFFYFQTIKQGSRSKTAGEVIGSLEYFMTHGVLEGIRESKSAILTEEVLDSIAKYAEQHNKPDLQAHARYFMGKLYKSQRFDEKAASEFERAIDLYKQFPKHRERMNSAGIDLATVTCILGDYETAHEMAQKNLTEAQRIFPSKHQQIGEAHHSIGYIEYRLGMLESAKEHARKAIAIQRKTANESGQYYAPSIGLLALIEEALENFESVAYLRLKMARSREHIHGEGSPHTHMAWLLYAGDQMMLGNLFSAETLFSKHFQYLKDYWGLNGDVLNIMLKYGRTLIYNQKLNQAKELFEEALEVLLDVDVNLNHKFTHMAQSHLVECLIESGEYQNIESDLKARVPLIVQRLRNDPIEGSRYMEILARLHALKKEPKKAEQLFKELEQRESEQAHGNHWLRARGKLHYAEFLVQEGRLEEAKKRLEQAVPILRNSPGPNHPLTLRAAGLLIDLGG